VDIIGEVLSRIQANDLSTFIKAAVVEHLTTDLLLGMNWIDRHVVTIDSSNRIIIVKDDSSHS
jgi:hypothetical protein